MHDRGRVPWPRSAEHADTTRLGGMAPTCRMTRPRRGRVKRRRPMPVCGAIQKVERGQATRRRQAGRRRRFMHDRGRAPWPRSAERADTTRLGGMAPTCRVTRPRRGRLKRRRPMPVCGAIHKVERVQASRRREAGRRRRLLHDRGRVHWPRSTERADTTHLGGMAPTCRVTRPRGGRVKRPRPMPVRAAIQKVGRGQATRLPNTRRRRRCAHRRDAEATVARTQPGGSGLPWWSAIVRKSPIPNPLAGQAGCPFGPQMCSPRPGGVAMDRLH
jgi:hypothetical protein